MHQRQGAGARIATRRSPWRRIPSGVSLVTTTRARPPADVAKPRGAGHIGISRWWALKATVQTLFARFLEGNRVPRSRSPILALYEDHQREQVECRERDHAASQRNLVGPDPCFGLGVQRREQEAESSREWRQTRHVRHRLSTEEEPIGSRDEDQPARAAHSGCGKRPSAIPANIRSGRSSMPTRQSSRP
jgi:hypothetical protein